MAERIIYTWDKTDLSTLGVIVKSSEGVLAIPEFKTPTSYDWADDHGSCVDLSKRRFKAKTIKISGYIQASNASDLMSKTTQLFNLLSGDGLHWLRIDVPNASAPLFYLVYIQKKLEIKKQWRVSSEMMAEFTLELIDPEPVKRVVRFPTTSASMSVSFKTTKPTTIYTQIAGSEVNVASGQVITTTRKGNTIEYMIITGDIDSITNYMALTGTTIWNKLY